MGAQVGVGGICGSISHECMINKCANLHEINSAGNVGGICGEASELVKSGTIMNSYNVSNVNGSGILGPRYGDGKKVTIENCYNKGETSANGKQILFLFSDEISDTVNCYYESNEETPTDTTGTPITTEIFKSAEMINKLGNAFKMDTGNINHGYPILEWQ